jgi:hypothetical protein
MIVKKKSKIEKNEKNVLVKKKKKKKKNRWSNKRNPAIRAVTKPKRSGIR